MIHLGILLLPGGSHASVLGIGEMLTLANSIAEQELSKLIHLGATSRAVYGYDGSRLVPHHSLSQHLRVGQPLDVLIIPPVLNDIDAVLRQKSLINHIKAAHEQGVAIATICAGSFLLAATGLLDGRTATTHWHMVQLFRDRFPSVNLQPQRMVIDGGDYICGGGVSAWTDVMTHLISRIFSPEIGQQCARMMLFDLPREHQTPYGSMSPTTNHGDHEMLILQHWLAEHYGEAITNERLATIVHLGVRTIQRRFLNATGISLKKYLQNIRIEQAQARLEHSNDTIASIANAVGYDDLSAFRKVFVRHLGNTPSEYRRRCQQSALCSQA